MEHDSLGTEEKLQVLRIESPWFRKMLGYDARMWVRDDSLVLSPNADRAIYELDIDSEGASVFLFPRNIQHRLCQADIANGGRELTRWVMRLRRESKFVPKSLEEIQDEPNVPEFLGKEIYKISNLIAGELERILQNHPDQLFVFPPNTPDSQARCI